MYSLKKTLFVHLDCPQFDLDFTQIVAILFATISLGLLQYLLNPHFDKKITLMMLGMEACEYSSIIRNYVSSVFFEEKVHFLPPKHASRCFSNEFSQRYWQESFDGDSFASQSRFDAYACGTTMADTSVGKANIRVFACFLAIRK